MIDKILFIPIIFFTAYLFKVFKIMKENDSNVFVNFVIYFALPAITFDLARDMTLGGKSAGVVLTAWSSIILGIAISWVVARAIGLSPSSARSFILVSSFGNTAFLGYPYALAYFGEQNFIYAVLYDQLGSFLMVITVGFILAVGKIELKEVLTFPPLIALVAGFVLKDQSFPQWLEKFLDISGSSLIPTVLFAMGLRFSFDDLRRAFLISAIVVSIKMVIVPLLTGGLLFATGLWGEPFRVALLQTSMPPMVMAGVLALKYNLDHKIAVSSIALGIILSFFTTTLIMGVFNQVAPTP